METFTVKQLADLTCRTGKSLGLDVEVQNLENPRKEMEDHYYYYNPAYHGLTDIGVEPHYLTENVMTKMFKKVMEYKNNIRKDVIFKGVKW